MEKINEDALAVIRELHARLRVEGFRLEDGDVIELLCEHVDAEETERRFKTTALGSALLTKIQRSHEEIGEIGPVQWMAVVRANQVGRRLALLLDTVQTQAVEWMRDEEAKPADLVLAGSFLLATLRGDIEHAIVQAGAEGKADEETRDFALKTLRSAEREGAKLAQIVAATVAGMESGEMVTDKGAHGRTTQTVAIRASASADELRAIADALTGKTSGEA